MNILEHCRSSDGLPSRESIAGRTTWIGWEVGLCYHAATRCVVWVPVILPQWLKCRYMMFPPQSATLPPMPPFEEACFFRVSFLFRLRRDSPSKWFWTRIALANRSKWVPSPLAALCQNELGVVWYLKDNLLTVCCLICSCSDADDIGVEDFPVVFF